MSVPGKFRALDGHTQDVESVAIMRRGLRVISGSRDSTLRLSKSRE